MYTDTNNPLDLSSEPLQSAYAKQNGDLVGNPRENDDRGRADKSDYSDERQLNGMHLGATNGCAGKFLHPFMSAHFKLFTSITVT